MIGGTDMKIYFNKKDRLIQRQKYMINRLQEENECLREQLELCDMDSVNEKINLAKESYKRYMGLIKELEELKHEYIELIGDIRRDEKRKLGKR